MIHDFRNGARSTGLDCEFMFGGNTYHLKTSNDAMGGLAALELDSKTVTKGLRASLQSESRMMSDGLAAGMTLDALIQQHARKEGEKVHMVLVLGERRTFAATRVWNAAMQIIEREYRREAVVRIGAKVSPLRVFDGGRA